MTESKIVKLIATVVMLVGVALGARAHAGAAPRVIVVVNRADWCSVCKANGERAAKAVMAGGAALQIVINDRTSDETTRTSSAALKAVGLDRAMAPHTATGVLTYFDARTRRQLRQITVAASDDELQQVTRLALQEASR